MNSPTISAVKHQVSCDLAGEAVILNLENGVYYGLTEVGARLWNLIQEPCTFSEILETLLAEYDVAPEACESQIRTLLTELDANGLIEVSQGVRFG
jgi:hypothetical protein